MPTSTAFNNFQNSGEQNLFQDLIIEQIKIFGVDFYYLPRSENHYDKLLGSDDLSSYESATMIEMYVDNPGEGFSSSGTLMSKFSNEIRDQLSFWVAQRSFQKEIGDNYDITLPKPKDLIYYPLDKKCYVITYVDTKVFKYPLGTLPVWKLDLELFEFSNEIIDTGIPEIDALNQLRSTNIYDYALRADNGRPLCDDNGNVLVVDSYDIEEIVNADNEETVEIADGILDFSEDNPFGEIT